jgi:hypothetical protein
MPMRLPDDKLSEWVEPGPLDLLAARDAPAPTGKVAKTEALFLYENAARVFRLNG